MHKKLFAVLLLLLAIGLAACTTSTASEQPVEAAATDTLAPAVESTQAATVTPEAEPVADAPTAEPAEETDAASAEAGPRTFTIAQDRSEVRFVIDEVLRGQPTTVVGVNNQVTGEVTVDAANPANTQIGPIQIDAAAFVTDEDMRNNAIRRFILQTDQYPAMTFVPTALDGLPESVNAGDSFNFQVTGDLTILDRTNPVTFDLAANAVSENEIQISGVANITRGDYGITIPSVPFVASVDEELVLELDLVMLAEASS